MRTCPLHPLSERRLARAQAVSGLLFATFLSLHLLNTVLALAGPSVYDGFQHMTRYYYQNRSIEFGLIFMAAGVHGGVGIIRMWRCRCRRGKGGRTLAPNVRRRLHRWSGMFLLIFIPAHVLATRGPGWYEGLDVGFSFVTFSMVNWPGMMVPYYVILFSAGFFHLIHGVPIAARRMGLPLLAGNAPRPRLFWGAVVAGTVVGLSAIAALAGWLFPVDTGRFGSFEGYYERHVPYMSQPWASAPERQAGEE